MSFIEGSVEADGLRIRYMDAGQGAPLVHLYGAGALRLTSAHDLLARHFRVVAFEMPGMPSMSRLAATMVHAITTLGLDTFNLVGTSHGGTTTALWVTLQAPERVLALVLEAPAGEAEDLESRLPGLATPTLALLGTRDSVISPAVGRVYKERLPNGHLVFVYDAGRHISADRPDAFADVVVDFLERHEAFVISRRETVIHP